MEKKALQQESKVTKMRRMLEEACKKNGWKLVDRKPNKDEFTISFKKNSDS